MILNVTLWAAAKDFFNEIEKDLSNATQVTDSKDYYFPTWESYDQFILGIYEPDSMPTWKIEKKLERMRKYKRVARMINIDISTPDYRTKSNGMPISVVTENIKRAIRQKYSFLKNFEGKPDVIIHMGDTHENTQYLNNVFEKHGKLLTSELDICNVISSFKKLDYFLVKRDTPANPKDFPTSYAVGKDLDVIIKKENLNKAKDIALKFSEQYKDKFTVKVIENPESFRIRFENNDMLHYQIDVSTSMKGLSKEFLEKCFSEKLLINDLFYELPHRYEAVVRTASLSQKPSKFHHYVFLRTNMHKIDLSLFEDVSHKQLVENFIRSNSQ
jgi:hypothetical protein